MEAVMGADWVVVVMEEGWGEGWGEEEVPGWEAEKVGAWEEGLEVAGKGGAWEEG